MLFPFRTRFRHPASGKDRIHEREHARVPPQYTASSFVTRAHQRRTTQSSHSQSPRTRASDAYDGAAEGVTVENSSRHTNHARSSVATGGRAGEMGKGAGVLLLLCRGDRHLVRGRRISMRPRDALDVSPGRRRHGFHGGRDGKGGTPTWHYTRVVENGRWPRLWSLRQSDRQVRNADNGAELHNGRIRAVSAGTHREGTALAAEVDGVREGRVDAFPCQGQADHGRHLRGPSGPAAGTDMPRDVKQRELGAEAN